MAAVVIGMTTAVLWLAAHGATAACERAAPSVERAIAEKARALRGVERCEHRHTLRADGDGDGAKDLLVLFGVEPRDGGTGPLYVLAVFPSDKRRPPAMTQIGTRGAWLAEDMRVEAGRILVQTKEYAREDPKCCPSKPGRLVFKLEHGALVDETSLWTVPPAPPGHPDVEPDPGLTKQDINAVVHAHLDAVKSCYEAELAKQANLSGELELAWTIAKDGHVERASVARSTLGNDDVSSCIVAEVRRWVFPQAEQATRVGRYPFVLKGNEPSRQGVPRNLE